MSWPPALEASGSDWQAAFVAQLLNDPYAVVRFMAGRSLKALSPALAEEYDSLAPAEQRQAVGRTVVADWLSNARLRDEAAILLNSQGLEHETIDRLMQERDNRPISISE